MKIHTIGSPEHLTLIRNRAIAGAVIVVAVIVTKTIVSKIRESGVEIVLEVAKDATN